MLQKKPCLAALAAAPLCAWAIVFLAATVDSDPADPVPLIERPWPYAASCPAGDGPHLKDVCSDSGSDTDSVFAIEIGYEDLGGAGGFDVCDALAAARNGDASQALKVAGALRRGVGLARDMCAAARWSHAAARAGSAEAAVLLGAHLELGDGAPQDFAQARGLYQRAAALGETRALTRLGAIYRDGLGVAHDLEKAEGYFNEAAQKGDPVGKMALADLYARGEVGQTDLAKAIKLSEEAAEAGHAPAMAQQAALQIWGALLSRKKKTSGDCPDGIAWAERAAEAGIGLGAALVGDAHLLGCGLAKSRQDAAHWYARAVESGFTASPRYMAVVNGEAAVDHDGGVETLPVAEADAGQDNGGVASTPRQANANRQPDPKPRRARAPSPKPKRPTIALRARKPRNSATAADPAPEQADTRRSVRIGEGTGLAEEDGASPPPAEPADAIEASSPGAVRDRAADLADALDATVSPKPAGAPSESRSSERPDFSPDVGSVLGVSDTYGFGSIDLR